MAADPTSATVVAGARGLALRMAYALAAALLVEQAACGDELAEVAARLWGRRWLRAEDSAVDAHHHLKVALLNLPGIPDILRQVCRAGCSL